MTWCAIPLLIIDKLAIAEVIRLLFQFGNSSGFCVKFFLANRRHHNWQPIHQNFTLRIIKESIDQFDQIAMKEFNTKGNHQLIDSTMTISARLVDK